RATGPLRHTRRSGRRGWGGRSSWRYAVLFFPALRWQRTLQRLELFEQVMTIAIALALVLLEQAQHDALGDGVAVFTQRGRARRGRFALHLEQSVPIAGAERQL